MIKVIFTVASFVIVILLAMFPEQAVKIFEALLYGASGIYH